MTSPITTLRTALSRDLLEANAGSDVFDRGERLLHAVTIEGDGDHQVEGAVRGTRLYEVGFRLVGGQIQSFCSCPHHQRGFFCKHLVALGLALLDEPSEPGVLSFDDDAFDDVPVPGHTLDTDPVSQMLASLDGEDLLTVLDALRDAVPGVEEYLAQLSHAVLTGSSIAADLTPEEVENHVRQLITDACRVGPFVDYHRAGEVADQLGQVVNEIEALAMAGHQKALIKQSRRLVDRISTILERTDDSDGYLGGVLEDAAALHAFICVTGEAHPGRVVDWVLKVQLAGPGWPEVSIADFWPILDDRAQGKYRRGLETALDSSEGDRHDSRRWSITRHLVEFADASGDVDLAVTTLEHTGNLKEAFHRLVEVNRMEQAQDLFEQMLGDWQGLPGHRLAAGEIVDILVATNRADEAVEFARRELGRHQSLGNYLLLVEAGRACGDKLQSEARAMITNVFALQEVLLHEEDTDALWELIATREAMLVPDSVITYFERNAPDRALELLIRLGRDVASGPAVEKNYKRAAELFSRARKLQPASLELSRTLTELRHTHYRRTKMLAIFDRHGL